MTQSPLAGRTALVTGGARGIGRGICLRLAREGIKVAVNYHSSESEARETAQQIEEMGSAAYTIQADVASKQAVDAMVEEVSEQLGPIDLLVNNAGIFEFVSHDQLTLDLWQKTLDTNLTGAFNTIWAVKPSMLERGYGRIVNVSSIGGIRARPKSIAYGASKAGLIMLTKGVAEALAPHNIRVNCLAPGLTDTDLPRQVAGPEVIDELIDATPMKRIGQPEDAANAVHFLLSDESSFMTGQTIVASGGRVLLP